MNILHQFIGYGEDLAPESQTIALDVGKKTVPGVIDHHHERAEAECTASLIVKYPGLVLDHLKPAKEKPASLRIITHRLPDFDSVASVFLALKLLETGRVDSSMAKIASYARLVDSGSLPKNIDLAATPYSVLRALFSRIKGVEENVNPERMREGLKFMTVLCEKAGRGQDILENRSLFSGVERFENALRKAENDYFNYLSDCGRSQKISLVLPLAFGAGQKRVDGLIVQNPRSFLLKEWARRDRENPPLLQGFSFVASSFGNQRYILGVDPDSGVSLKGLGDLLNGLEAEKRKVQDRPFPRPWYDGNCPLFNFRIIDSPQDETSLTHEEIVRALFRFSEGLASRENPA